MQNSRLLELFTSLEKSEQRELGKFVRSPVFNQRADVEALYQYLYQNSPFKDPAVLQRELVFGQVYPGVDFDAGQFDYLMSFLFSVIKSYLIDKEHESDKIGNQLGLVRALRRRNLGRLLDKELKNAEKILESQPFRDAEYHFDNYQLHLEKHTIAKSESRTTTASLGEFSLELTHYFLAKKLWIACTVQTLQAMEQVHIREEGVLEAVLHLVENNDYQSSPAVNLYYHCYKALTDADSLRWFEALRALIRAHHSAFPQGELRDLYLVAINYCIGKSNKGETVFLSEAFQLYKEGLELKVFLENNLLSRFTYNNIVMSGLLLKELDWVERFLYQYKEHIEPKFQESTFNYNLAIYYYHKPDYEKAMILLQQSDFHDLQHNLSARRMLLKIFFQRDEREALSSLIISFKNFIYRHRELGSVPRNSYLNLLKFARQLLNLPQYEKEAVAALRREVEETEPVAEKGWLLEVLNQTHLSKVISPLRNSEMPSTRRISIK